MAYDPRYVRFLHLFNVEQDYFECHEVLEELWMDEALDPFWQGLLQVAVALFHARNGNVGGAVKLMEAGLDKLSREEGRDAGIDLARLREDGERWLNRLKRRDGSPFPFEPLSIIIADPTLEGAVVTLRNRDSEGRF